jgi:two-component system sensor histidine kinase DegS
MNSPTSSLPVTYHSALRDYLAQPNETTLQQAYELGRAAMSAGLGVFDVIRLHHQALNDDVVSRDPAAVVRCAPMLEAFLLETLSPFEAAHRGFRRAWERLEQLNSTLAGHNEALALSNAQLEEEISMRQRTEAQLREAKEHYFQLFQKAHEMEESLRDLSAQVLTAQEEERKRISRELHDEIGQALTAVNVTIAMLKRHATSDPELKKKIADAERLLASSMETVHTFARELRPAMLDHLGVHPALRALVGGYAERTNLTIELGTHPELSRVSGPCGEALFRVTQEALNNIVKHAHASKVSIAFSATPDLLTMEIADNGRAFSVEEKLGRRSGRLGLLGMQERMRLVHGHFAIESAVGRGTRVTAQVPLSAPTPPSASSEPQSDYHENDICVAR